MALTPAKAAVVATGWVGDTIACTAAATSLSELGYQVTFYMRWPQLVDILKNDTRYKTVLYRTFSKYKIQRPFFPSRYELIAREPTPWSYNEPFTAEIRRLCGVPPTTEYELLLPHNAIESSTDVVRKRPMITVSRDIDKRAFGRDIPDLIERLSQFFDITWVGLAPQKTSKRGKRLSLLPHAQKIAQSDAFFGPEGGLLWLAAGIGKRCFYLTENIDAVAKKLGNDKVRQALGPANHFPAQNHIAFPPYCDNQLVVDELTKHLIS